MSSSNCCFLTCIQVSQEAGQVVWYSHLLQYFPQFIVIHTVKGFGIVNKAEIDAFLELSCLFDVPADVGSNAELPPGIENTVVIILYFSMEHMKWLICNTSVPFPLLYDVKSLSRVWLCDPMDCSLPGSSVHGIFQARVLEWVAISFSRGSSSPRDQTQVSHSVGRRFTVWARWI